VQLLLGHSYMTTTTVYLQLVNPAGDTLARVR
jgi:site-specific recombinase XerD